MYDLDTMFLAFDYDSESGCVEVWHRAWVWGVRFGVWATRPFCHEGRRYVSSAYSDSSSRLSDSSFCSIFQNCSMSTPGGPNACRVITPSNSGAALTGRCPFSSCPAPELPWPEPWLCEPHFPDLEHSNNSALSARLSTNAYMHL